MKGKIVKIISKFSYVEIQNFKVYECVPKGIFRHRNIKPIVGDNVIIEVDNNEKGLIIEILNRKNELVRPTIANVDQVIIVTSSKKPKFSTFMLNKYLSHYTLLHLC